MSRWGRNYQGTDQCCQGETRDRVELNEPKVVIDYAMPLPINGLNTTEEVLFIGRFGSP